MLSTVCRFQPRVIDENPLLNGGPSFIKLIVSLIGSKNYVRNPYIRAKLVQVLRHIP